MLLKFYTVYFRYRVRAPMTQMFSDSGSKKRAGTQMYCFSSNFNWIKMISSSTSNSKSGNFSQKTFSLSRRFSNILLLKELYNETNLREIELCYNKSHHKVNRIVSSNCVKTKLYFYYFVKYR